LGWTRDEKEGSSGKGGIGVVVGSVFTVERRKEETSWKELGVEGGTAGAGV